MKTFVLSPLAARIWIGLKLSAITATGLLALPTAHAYEPNALGLSSSLNLLAFGNFYAPSSDVQGQVAVGGNAAFTGYSINTKGVTPLYTTGTGLTVGGNLTFGAGGVYGNTVVGGNLTTGTGASFLGDVWVKNDLNANGNWLTAGTISYGGTASNVYASKLLKVDPSTIQTGINFASEQTRLTALSQSFDSLANTGTSFLQDSTFALNANSANVAVFDVNAADVGYNLSLGSLAANTTVVINVHGETVDFGGHGYDGFALGQVLFNLPDAKSITFASSVNASFLAPQATFYTPIGGLISGQVVVASWDGKGQVNDAAFQGALTPVPEPSEYVLLLAGLAMIGFLKVDRRVNRASWLQSQTHQPAHRA